MCIKAIALRLTVIVWLISVCGCSPLGSLSRKSSLPPVLEWNEGMSELTKRSVSGTLCKALDFEITPEMVAGLPDDKVEVTIRAASASLVECDRLTSKPNYDDPFALLLEMNDKEDNQIQFPSLEDYLTSQQRQMGKYKLLDIAYYLPFINSREGELRPFCVNGKASAQKITKQWLPPGQYRIVFSSYPEFFTDVTLYCWPANKHKVVSISANDLDQMTTLYSDRVH